MKFEQWRLITFSFIDFSRKYFVIILIVVLATFVFSGRIRIVDRSRKQRNWMSMYPWPLFIPKSVAGVVVMERAGSPLVFKEIVFQPPLSVPNVGSALRDPRSAPRSLGNEDEIAISVVRYSVP